MTRKKTPPRRVLGKPLHADVSGKASDLNRLVYAWVRKIPPGRVMTYGQISGLLKHRISARAVGWIMHASPKGVPWQRVVNASGGCSTDRLADFPKGLQKHLLETEGVTFRENATLDLKRFRWVP